jgi:hypothetical protein
VTEENVRQAAAIPGQEARLRALARANEVRVARAELRRQIAHQQVAAAEVLLHPPPAVLRWPVAELLISQPQWGRAKCRKFLSRNQVGELKAVGALTERQRCLLAGQLSTWPGARSDVQAKIGHHG